ncbi:16S rRNA (guanine(966)-N(2))-methyltransferase RsmD [Rhabdothermincola salaria]|uniref:16S rRNA (guanine(966)-N(2))-methyltransferase RsmD n=1 Tax=Rhabdothermincola salaria TaxID=2903142 RepID=UPI001E4D289B|nr:16S rRNA (guanine(966)-N(2))-methyltransferase RsmD [Rhabdothermincola salaria]MCD9624968.1 16S rRNA (guanine(966)-N(2))-methyltransferase RsmD [Rhabdothermincola salaria]
MRVVAGSARGRRLQAPPGADTRPTLDRVREALFNALHSLDAVDGARVLDLFAGSGALGIEALSRGATQCVFVERARRARQVVEANLAATDLAGAAEVVGGDALDLLRRWTGENSSAPGAPTPSRFDLVLLDPPYATTAEEWARLLELVGALAPTGVVVLESSRSVAVPPGWHVLREKRYGDTLLSITRPTSPPPEPS